MPFKSQSQRRLFYAKQHLGKFTPEMVAKWEAHTPKGKLPEKASGAYQDDEEQAEPGKDYLAHGVSEAALQGSGRGPTDSGEEKAASIGFLIKRADYSTYDVQDLDATYQSPVSPNATGRKEVGDAPNQQAGVGSGEMGDIPITEDDAPVQTDRKSPGALMKRAYKLQGHLEVQGLPIAVENKAGSIRRGKNEDGTEWETHMHYPYGFLEGTEGADGEEVDCYVGPEKEAPDAFVVHQKDAETGDFDEDKVMLQFASKKDAKEAFEEHYDEPEKYLGPISRVSMERLKELVAAKEKLVKISHVSYLAMLDELCKQASAGITFPAHEHGQLRERLESGKDAYTTRIQQERGKYSVGQVLESPFGKLRVVSVLPSRGKHPFEKDLTAGEKKQIGAYPFDLVRLTKQVEEQTNPPVNSPIVNAVHGVVDPLNTAKTTIGNARKIADTAKKVWGIGHVVL